MQGRVEDCYPAMLKHWVEQTTPTWSTLIEALESEVIGRSDIAGEIRSHHKTKGGNTERIGEDIKIASVLPQSFTNNCSNPE